jgi:hypothetical protein
MILILEIGMLVMGLIALIGGRLPTGRGRVCRGTAARVIGGIWLLPLPLSFFLLAPLFLADAGKQKATLGPQPAFNWTAVAIEAGVTLGCLLLGCSIMAVTGESVRDADDATDYEWQDRERRRARRRPEPESGQEADTPQPADAGGSEAVASGEPPPRARPPRPEMRSRGPRWHYEEEPPRRNYAPWIVGGLAVVLCGCIGVGVAGWVAWEFLTAAPGPQQVQGPTMMSPPKKKGPEPVDKNPDPKEKTPQEEIKQEKPPKEDVKKEKPQPFEWLSTDQVNQPKPIADPPKASYAGKVRMGDGFTATETRSFGPGTLLPMVLWAEDGKSLMCCQTRDQTLYHFEVPSFELKAGVKLSQKPGWISRCRLGLLVTLPDLREVWLLDEQTFAVKQRIKTPESVRVVSAPPLAVAFVTGHLGAVTQKLYCLDLQQQKVTVAGNVPPSRGGLMTRDGKFLFTRDHLAIHRLRVEGTEVHLDASRNLTYGENRELVLSAAGDFVLVPKGKVGSLQDQAAAVIRTKNLDQSLAPWAADKPLTNLVYWPANERFWARTESQQVQVLDHKGKVLAEAKSKLLPGGFLQQMDVAPDGAKLLLVYLDKLVWVEPPPGLGGG